MWRPACWPDGLPCKCSRRTGCVQVYGCIRCAVLCCASVSGAALYGQLASRVAFEGDAKGTCATGTWEWEAPYKMRESGNEVPHRMRAKQGDAEGEGGKWESPHAGSTVVQAGRLAAGSRSTFRRATRLAGKDVSARQCKTGTQPLLLQQAHASQRMQARAQLLRKVAIMQPMCVAWVAPPYLSQHQHPCSARCT